jgi:hypothetical protein
LIVVCRKSAGNSLRYRSLSLLTTERKTPFSFRWWRHSLRSFVRVSWVRLPSCLGTVAKGKTSCLPGTFRLGTVAGYRVRLLLVLLGVSLDTTFGPIGVLFYSRFFVVLSWRKQYPLCTSKFDTVVLVFVIDCKKGLGKHGRLEGIQKGLPNLHLTS